MTQGCSIAGCGKRVLARGWCDMHYTRWRRHGDPLGGGVPHGEPLQHLNEVVLAHEGNECLTWPYATNDKGYGQIRFDGKTRTVHRLVCISAHGEPPTPEHEAAHSCGNGHLGCVAKRHLSWKTVAGNAADRIAHGRQHNRGERHRSAKLLESQVVAIRKMRGLERAASVARRYGVNHSTIANIYKGETWTWLA